MTIGKFYGYCFCPSLKKKGNIKSEHVPDFQIFLFYFIFSIGDQPAKMCVFQCCYVNVLTCFSWGGFIVQRQTGAEAV